MKIEQRKVRGPEWGAQVKQTALLASAIYIGQAQGEENKMYKKRSQNLARASLLFSSCLLGQPTLTHREGNGTPLQYSCLEKSHGRRSLVGCSSWGRWGLDPTQWLHFHFSFSCTGEGNGNPLQCSCLENPRNGGAWCAAVYWGHTESVGHDWSDLAAAILTHWGCIFLCFPKNWAVTELLQWSIWGNYTGL